MLVGGAGDAAAISRVFLEFSLEVDTPEAFLVLVEETLKEVDYTADFLMATRDGLFLLDHTLALITLDHVFAAIGSGADTALGCLYGIFGIGVESDRLALSTAVRAASTFCVSVGQPGKVFEL
jgi:ATP-dependent protease HslVU (ClpYQ) peptidase subunit